MTTKKYVIIYNPEQYYRVVELIDNEFQLVENFHQPHEATTKLNELNSLIITNLYWIR